ncbi:MAG: methyltransferase domain-containing protein [Bacteroidales bacterium]|nr:methyltransferase domain-containing protein [Bacteroidales bacterium]
MQYDPIKRSLGAIFNTTPVLRKLFYRLLDLLLLRAWHIKKELRQFAKDAPDHACALDAGSGFGQYVYYMSCKNPSWNVIGADVKTEQIEDCNRFFKKINFNNVGFEFADLTKFNHPEKYNFILSVDVMEHILEDVQVFKNFYASMKKGGMLLISTPSDQGGSDVHDHDHDEGSFIDEHVRDGYNIDEIQEKLKLAGFTKTEAYYSYGKPGSKAWRLSMKYPLLMLNRSKAFFLILPLYYILTFPLCLVLNKMDVAGKHNSGTGLIVKAWK